MSKMISKLPKGPISEKWTSHKGKINLVSPSNKRLIDVIVVGTGLAGCDPGWAHVAGPIRPPSGCSVVGPCC